MSKTTSSKTHCKKLVDSVFERDIYVIVGPRDDAVVLLNTRFGEDGPDDDFDAGFFETHDGSFVIWVDDFDASPLWYGNLAHEVGHTVLTILPYLGIKHSTATEEVFCYYTGSLVKQIVTFVHNKYKK